MSPLDETPRFTSDDRVQRLDAWKHDQGGVYQDHKSILVAAAAARVRDQVRGRATRAPQTPRLNAEAAVELVLSTLPQGLRAAMRKQVETLVA